MQWREGTVQRVRGRWPGAVENAVELASPDDGATAPHTMHALAYTALVGEPQVGDRVLLNASALLRGLGTGGLAFVVAAPDRLPPDPVPGDGPQGHIVKARYTPQQQMLMAVDEQDSPHHDVMTSDVVASGDLQGMPVVVADLHSGLLAARHVLDAEVAVVIQGPGNVGTGTTWGYTGVATGEALNAAWTLHGRGVAALRVSQADPRERHRGISHHSHTAYGRICLVAADLVALEPTNPFEELVVRQAQDLVAEASGMVRLVRVDGDGLPEALATSPVRLSTMGRGLDVDRAAFLYSAAAGRHAAHLLT
jgi:hypothetical protein